MERVFIVEDDEKLRKELKKLLENNGYKCIIVEDFETVIDDILKIYPNLVLLDINLPVYDGFYICKELREKSDIPVIALTSNASDIDELEMLNSGADDFVSKPFNPRILLAHISSVLKRTYGTTKKIIISHNGVVLDVLKSKVVYNDKFVDLTRNELIILKLLMENKGNIIPRNEIISVLWDSEEFVEDGTLTVNINRLRRKLESIGLREFLVTKRGQGYVV